MMGVHPITLLYGGGCAIALLFAYQAQGRERDDARVMGLLVVGSWLFNTATRQVLPGLPHMALYGPVDVLIGGIAVSMCRQRLRPEKVILAADFFFETLLHLDFQAQGNFSALSRHDYMLILNLAFVVQLICVATPGGGRVLELARRLGLVPAARRGDHIRPVFPRSSAEG